jgi:DNA processing protein
MKQLREKLLIGDYYQYFTYPVRKQIVALFKDNQHVLLAQILHGLIQSEKVVQLAEDIQTITLFDARYPSLLLESYDPPLVLYAKGDISLLSQLDKLAIIGSRTPQRYSLDAVAKIITDIKQTARPPIIVSGLAKGIDGRAHALALSHEIPTIAVLGFGFDYMYPSENKQLAQRIESAGLLLSEYPPHIGINRWQFVARNRIIASLCQRVIIVEAKEKSGSLITAELALAENRDVFIVSGKGFDASYTGSHTLIQEGAKLLLDMKEVTLPYVIEHHA